jgi:hypothetical protein
MPVDPTTGAEVDPYLAWARSPVRLPGEAELDAAIAERSLRNQTSQQIEAVTNALGPKAGFNYEQGIRYGKIDAEHEAAREERRKAEERAMLASVGQRSPDGLAHIAQATGPTGTIGQIGEELPYGAIDAAPLSFEEAQQIEMGAPPLSPEEEAQIEIDPYVAAYSQPPVDAISGADFAPGMSDLIGPVTYEQMGQEPQAPDAYLEGEIAKAQGPYMLPSQREQAIGDATTTAVNAMSPEQFVQFQADREGKVIAEKARLEHEAAAQSEQRARESLEAQRAAVERARADTADMLAAAQALSKVKVNPDRYKQERGIGGTVRDVAGIFLMGLGGNVDGGLRVLEQRIDRDIAAQNADIANGWQGVSAQKGAIADEYARHGDSYRASETYRVAAYQAAINDIDSQLQLYDPAGSTAIRGRGAREKLQAAQAQAATAFEEKQRANHEKAWRLAIDIRKQQLEEDKFVQAKALAAAKASAAGAAKKVKPDDVIQSPEYFEAVYGKRPPLAMSQNGFEQWAKTGKVVEEYGKAQRENSPEERNRQLAVGELADVDGKPLQFRSPESAEKVATLKGAADFGVQLIDRLKTSYEIHGWSSDLLKSPEWQEAQADLNQYMLEKKNIDALGVLAGPDLDLIKGTMGKVDPTGIRDPGPGLSRARVNVVEKLNAQVRAQVASGQKPRRWDPPKPPPPAPTTPTQDAVKALLGVDSKEMDAESALVTGGDFESAAGTIPSKYTHTIDRLVGVFNDPNASAKEQDEAAAHLEALKSKARSSRIREYATKAAADAVTKSLPVSTE